MSETQMAPYPQEEQGDSFFSRAMNVFIAPASAFESIANRPDFWWPLVVVLAASYAIVELMLEKIGAGQIVRRSIELSGQAAKMTPDQVEQAVTNAGKITAIIMRVLGVVAPPIVLLIIAAVGLLFLNAIFGASLRFKTCFSVVCYANLVGLVGFVLGFVMILFGDPEQFNPSNFVPTNVAFFLNPLTTPKPLYVIASSFDIFQVWVVLLSSLGLSVAARRKVSTTAVFLCYLGAWVLWVLVRAGWAALMS